MAASNKSINVTIEQDEPKTFNPKLSDAQKRADNLSRMSEKGLINEKSGSSLALRENGQTNLSAGKYAQYKMNPNGKVMENSLQSVTITNRKEFKIDEITVNEHKLNPRLYELADFRKITLDTNKNAIVGNFCLNGSVLVKAWEPNLKRYMLIRRPARLPMFGPLLNVPEIPTALKVNDPLKVDESMLGISADGYQVNAAISDKNTLVGKKGVDRKGIDRTPEKSGGIIGASNDNSSGPGANHSCNPGPAKGIGKDNIPSDAEQWTVNMAVRSSGICGLPADWLWAQWKHESNFDASDGNYNFGGIRPSSGMESNAYNFAVFHSAEEWADYFGKYILLWNDPPVTQAKTMKEYVHCLQNADGGKTKYCSDPADEDLYYNTMAECLGNQGTVIK
jgi:hypothetical protein